MSWRIMGHITAVMTATAPMIITGAPTAMMDVCGIQSYLIGFRPDENMRKGSPLSLITTKLMQSLSACDPTWKVQSTMCQLFGKDVGS